MVAASSAEREALHPRRGGMPFGVSECFLCLCGVLQVHEFPVGQEERPLSLAWLGWADFDAEVDLTRADSILQVPLRRRRRR